MKTLSVKLGLVKIIDKIRNQIGRIEGYRILRLYNKDRIIARSNKRLRGGSSLRSCERLGGGRFVWYMSRKMNEKQG